MKEFKELLEELDKVTKGLESDIKECEKGISRDSRIRKMVLESNYSKILGVTEELYTKLKGSKGGEDEVIYPSA
jgi:hypothetical protein